MYLSIDHSSGIPVSAQILDQIKYLVVSGSLAPGERIPSVRGLAKQLKLNPTTVARVYRQLEAEEIIYTQPGRGAFIAHKRSALTSAEKRRRVQDAVRHLVVEAGRIDLDYKELLRIVEAEIEKMGSSFSLEKEKEAKRNQL
jgi:GntR family transcriptional regulator